MVVVIHQGDRTFVQGNRLLYMTPQEFREGTHVAEMGLEAFGEGECGKIILISSLKYFLIPGGILGSGQFESVPAEGRPWRSNSPFTRRRGQRGNVFSLVYLG